MVQPLCRMCAKPFLRLSIEFCPKCEADVDKAVPRYKGKRVSVVVSAQAMEIWLLKKVAKKLDRPLATMLQQNWNQVVEQLIRQHLGMHKVSDEWG